MTGIRDDQFYQDTRGEWRWRVVAGNNKIIADSGEGYDSKWNAERAFEDVFDVDLSSTAYPNKFNLSGGDVDRKPFNGTVTYQPIDGTVEETTNTEESDA